jgi:lysozyme family protein
MQTDIIGAIIAREGGFVDHPEDRGGPTKYGVTLASLQRWRQHPCQKSDIQTLTEPEARQILTELFLIQPGFQLIADQSLRAFVTDWGVNSGPTNAIKALQDAVSVTQDGVLGPQTIKAINAMDPRLLFLRVFASRLKFIGHLLSRQPSQAVFAEGWLTRLADFLT